MVLIPRGSAAPNFIYYGFYTGSFYPREYLQAGFLLVKQVKHYSSNLKRLRIAKELIGAALHNILRNLRYRDSRGIDLLKETEAVQTEVLRLENVKEINELMGCEGRARAAYYQAFGKIIKRDVEFKKASASSTGQYGERAHFFYQRLTVERD